ncbi:fasciclin-like arabinogalactan protein 21 [Olea europaea var. sylvestris]|uniref:fasciclin-like arabinogalactan protein 21 n=1 Tax=Olea europaea var. sylvestris TaxID=158386 RepID=UPI000C1D455E|nr:fasciclin-like arabinogalactan protein 21 [Olea europaea var. sylvestris]
MANCTCSHWWHAPFYFSMSIVLCCIAITTMKNSAPKNPLQPGHTIKHDLALNASRALRIHGFNAIATLLQISPELFLSGPESTIFAIQDSAMSNVSVPPWVMKQLLQYHTSPSKLPMQELMKKPHGSCLTTLVYDKNLMITTKNDTKRGSIEINSVLISHPDIFLEGPVSVHGVLRPFSDIDQDWNFIQSPVCNSNQTLVSNPNERRNMVEWARIVQLLSSNGFVSFAIGLHSVLNGIIQDYPDLGSVTIFAPPNSGFISSPWPLLYKIVRSHILHNRFTYLDLTSLPKNNSLRNLVPGEHLQISKNKLSRLLVVNGVEITLPDILSSQKFVIHGISRAFEVHSDGFIS